VSGTDLVAAIQSELPIPTTISELPSSGILGLCINLITIVHAEEEDPVECIVRAFEDAGIDFTCFPGEYDRESQRNKERDREVGCISVHRFQIRLPNPKSNQAKALLLLSKMQE
jgi:hypothetical protein